MVTGASTADLAIIIVDARKGLLTQTCRHSTIVSLMGVRHVVLAVNKMDLVDYSEQRFAEIVAAYSHLAERLGLAAITAIPISALLGDNVIRPSAAMPWYGGPTLLDHLESVDVEASERSRFAMRCSGSVAPTRISAAMPAPCSAAASGPATRSWCSPRALAARSRASSRPMATSPRPPPARPSP